MIDNIYRIKRSNIKAEETEEFGVPAVVLYGVRDFSLEKTFDCGQSFRFEKKEEERFDCCVRGIAMGKLIEIGEKEGVLYLLGATLDDYKNTWKHYLGLDMNYTKMAEDILRDTKAFPIVKTAYGYSEGIRILNQEHWETLCTFIISQNNNIPRIKMIVERLCRGIGEKFIGFDGSECFAFPSPERILKEGDFFLREIGTGFRAKYILDAAERVASHRTDFGYLEECEDTSECIRHLSEIYGVGEKVASCTLLFSFEKFDAFPKDVWIKRVLENHFAKDFDDTLLGEYRGIVQQWLFFGGRWMDM